MTQRAAFPGEVFPAFPALSVDLPDDWDQLVIADTVLAGGAPEEPGVFRTNVCVSVSRTPGSRTIEEAAGAVSGALEAAPEYAEVGRAFQEVAGAPGFRIEGSFAALNAGTLYQAAHIAVFNHGTVCDTVTAVATVTASRAQEAVPVLRGILDSLRHDG